MARSKKRRKFNFAKDFFTITVVLATLFAISKLIIKKPDNPNLIIATINGDNIYKTDITKKLNEIFDSTNQDSQIPPINEMPKEVLEIIVKEIYTEKQLTRQAKDSGVERDGAVALRAEEARSAVILAAYLEDEIESKVTDKAIHNKYLELNSKVEGKKEYSLAHIVVEEEKTAKKVLKQLKKSTFAKMSKKHSIDYSSANNGGDLGYVLEDNLVPQMSDVIKELKVDQVSKPIKTEYGWHLVKLTDIRDAKMPEFEEVKLQIQEQLKQETINEIKDKIIKKAKIEILIPLKEVKEKEEEEDEKISK